MRFEWNKKSDVCGNSILFEGERQKIDVCSRFRYGFSEIDSSQALLNRQLKIKTHIRRRENVFVWCRVAFSLWNFCCDDVLSIVTHRSALHESTIESEHQTHLTVSSYYRRINADEKMCCHMWDTEIFAWKTNQRELCFIRFVSHRRTSNAFSLALFSHRCKSFFIFFYIETLRHRNIYAFCLHKRSKMIHSFVSHIAADNIKYLKMVSSGSNPISKWKRVFTIHYFKTYETPGTLANLFIFVVCQHWKKKGKESNNQPAKITSSFPSLSLLSYLFVGFFAVFIYKVKQMAGNCCCCIWNTTVVEEKSKRLR